MSNKSSSSFPFIQQLGFMECGSTCLAMIFKHYGYYNIQSFISRMAEVSTSGIDLYSLGEVANQFGFEADAYEMGFEYLSEIPMPCIAHYNGNHFVVIYKFTEEFVWIADPAYGKDKMAKEDFLKKWNNIVLSVKPTKEIFKNKDLEESVQDFLKKKKSLFSKFYAPVINSLKGVFWQILIASGILQMLGLALPFFTQSIIDYVLVNHNKKLLIVILAGMFCVFLAQVVLLYIRNIFLVHMRVHFELGFFSQFFKHFISLFQSFYDRHKREDFMSRFQENITIRQLVNPNVIESIVDMAFVLLYVPVLIIYNTKLGLVALAFVIVYALFSILYTPKIRSLANKVFYKNLETLGDFLDTLLGMQSVKLLSIENFKFWQWKNKYKRTLNVVMEAEKQGAILHSIQRSIHFVSQIGIFWIGAYMAFNQEITIGQYLAITAIFTIVLNSLNNLSMIWYNLTELSVSIERLNDVLMEESESKPILDTINQFNTFPVKFSNFNFKYLQNQPEYVLQDLNLEINKGEHIGIAGRNGSGKSTLVKMMLNLYPNYSGQLSFGSADMQQLGKASLRKKVFMFPQEVYIFNGTIKENILYGNLNASVEEVIQAAKLADIHDFVSSQYHGYNFQIGDMGSNLSGGQKLKIGFARLFISNPDLIILDEASSMLDVESERIIMNNIKKHFKDKTILSIAHRMQTLKLSDRILVMDKGQIAEEGTHDELIERPKGIYAGFMKNHINF